MRSRRQIAAQPKNRPAAAKAAAVEIDKTERAQAPPGKEHVYLERWKARANARRVQIAERLASMPPNLKRLEDLKLWAQNLASRRSWLEARLEHLKAVEGILHSAIQDGMKERK